MISTTENAGGQTTLTDIESLTKTFADEHAKLVAVASEMTTEFEATKQKYLEKLRAAVGRTAQAKLTLHTAIAGSPDLFEKPRTHVFHGVKVGLQKGKGGIEFADPDKVVALIRKHFGDDAIAYLRSVETPDKKMLANLPVTELKKLGCTIADSGDLVVISTKTSEIEKAVTALIKDTVEK